MIEQRNWDDRYARAVVATAIVVGVDAERRVLENRLQIERESIFDRYDRMVAEAEFRVTCAIPLTALIIAVSIDTGKLWLLTGLVFPVAIFTLGVRRYYEGRAVMWEALSQGLIESNTVEAARDYVEKVRLNRDRRSPDDEAPDDETLDETPGGTAANGDSIVP